MSLRALFCQEILAFISVYAQVDVLEVIAWYELHVLHVGIVEKSQQVVLFRFEESPVHGRFVEHPVVARGEHLQGIHGLDVSLVHNVKKFIPRGGQAQIVSTRVVQGLTLRVFFIHGLIYAQAVGRDAPSHKEKLYPTTVTLVIRSMVA